MSTAAPHRARRPPPLVLGGSSDSPAAAADAPLQLVDGTPPVTPSDGGSLGRLFDALTPLTRKVSKLPMAEVKDPKGGAPTVGGVFCPMRALVCAALLPDHVHTPTPPSLSISNRGWRLWSSRPAWLQRRRRLVTPPLCTPRVSLLPTARKRCGGHCASEVRWTVVSFFLRLFSRTSLTPRPHFHPPPGDSCDAAASPAAAAALAASDAAAAVAAAATTTSGRWSDVAWSASAGTGSLCVLGGPGDDEDDTATSSGAAAAAGPAWSRSPTRGRDGGDGGRATLWRSLQASLKLSSGAPPLSAGGGSPDKGLRRPGGGGGSSRRRLGGGGGLIRSGSMAAAAVAESPQPPDAAPAHPAALAARAAAVLALAAPARAEPVAWLWLLVEANAAAVAAGAVAVPGGSAPGGPGAAAAARVLASASLSSWPAGGLAAAAAAAAAAPPSSSSPTVDSTAPLLYLARVARRLAPEEGWLRLTAAALGPALAALRVAGDATTTTTAAATPLPPSAERALAAVAPRAMAMAEDAVRRHRSLRSGRRDNAATLAAAARLLALLSACGPNGDGDSSSSSSGLGEVLAGLVAEGMAARYAALAAATGAASGGGGGGGAEGRSTPSACAAGLADLMDGLATDLADDAEVYGPALAAWAGLDLPAVTARAALACLKKDVAAFRALPLTPAVGGAAPRAAVAAAALHARAARHAPAAADAALFPGGQPAFRPAVEAWLGGVAAKLAAASARLLAAEEWSGGGGGPSRSLVDFFSALCAVAEGEAALARSHRSHAGALESTLAGAVSTHAAGLAAVAESALGGRPPGGRVSGGSGPAAAVARVKAAAAAARRGGPTGASSTLADPLAPPPRLLGALADLRACGACTADVGSALRSAVPRAWWGEAWDADDGCGGSAVLGDALRAVRAECDARLARLCADAGRAAAAALRKEVAAALDAETAAAAAAEPSAASSAARPTGPLGPADAAAAAAQRALRSRVRGWGAAACGGGGRGHDARVCARVGLEAWSALADGLQGRALGGVPPPSGTGPLGKGAAAVPPTLLPRAVGGLRVLASLEAAFLIDSPFGLAGTDVPPAAAKARRAFTDTLQAVVRA